MIYLDWAATALPDDEVVNEVAAAARTYLGNPSSRHAEGRKAAAFLDECRGRIAAVLDVPPPTLYFTSGATESNNLAVLAELHRDGRGHLVVTDREHPSLSRPVEHLARFGFDVTTVHRRPDGTLSVEDVLEVIRDNTVFVASTLVESTTGAILDVAAISNRIRELNRKRNRPIHHHCDCVQGLGKIPFSLEALGVDTASFSAHKICGPRGVGALFVDRAFDSPILGGGQERDLRPGTENVAGIAGFALAAERFGVAPDVDRAVDLCTMLVEGIELIPGGRIAAPRVGCDWDAGYSPYILQAAFPPVPGEVLSRVLSDRGVAVSTGSACAENLGQGTSRSDEHVIRISTGFTTGEGEVRRFLSVLESEVSALTKVLG